MAMTLRVRDETMGGPSRPAFDFEFPSDELTVRELIRERVYQEVQDHELRTAGLFDGLVRPTDAEATLNGYASRPVRAVDWRAQFERACRAFEEKVLLVIVGDRQVTSLDERLFVTSGTAVTFLKLVPLVGG